VDSMRPGQVVARRPCHQGGIGCATADTAVADTTAGQPHAEWRDAA
jgi:hypothetical protein